MLYIILFLIIYLLFYIMNKNLITNKENFVNKNLLENNDTFYNFLKNNKNIEIIDTKEYIEYKNNKLTGHIGTNIYYEIYSKEQNKKYIILRYADFRNEIKRHSISNINNYLQYLKNNFFNTNNNYILDFTGFHGYIDNKVNLWISIKNKYGRKKANEIMCTTYLIPNDETLFEKEYNPNQKYILKNSFGGARSAIQITNSLKKINYYFNENKNNNFNPEKCEDAICHSKVKYNILQEFINPGLLIHNRKIGIRFYMVIYHTNNNLEGYLYKNGICYYSKNEYNQNTNELNNNVVGLISNMQDYIQENNLPIDYLDYVKYLKKNYKLTNTQINQSIKQLQEYCKIIINSNREKLIFINRTNIKKYSIYALDVEFNKEQKPYIFEGNFYFARYKSNNIYGKILMDLYNDVYCKLGINKEYINGFYDLHI